MAVRLSDQKNPYVVPWTETIKQARCHSFCVAETPDSSSSSCQDQSCQECLLPCETPSTPTNTCLANCANRSYCKKACRFLALYNNTNVEEADGTPTLQPGPPTAQNATFLSVTLSWQPHVNATKDTVYALQIQWGGDLVPTTAWKNLNLISHKSSNTVKENGLCDHIEEASKVFPQRQKFDGIWYKFRVAALTENSSIIYGPASSKIWLPRPRGVANLTYEITYDSKEQDALNKLDLKAIWQTTDGGGGNIKKYAVTWDLDNACTFPLPSPVQKTISPGSLSAILDVYHEQKTGCKNSLKVYSLVGCSVSNPAVNTFEYPGCTKVKDFPFEECCNLEPPVGSVEELVVRNITRGPLVPSQEFQFSTLVSWEEPIYPKKYNDCNVVRRYRVEWGKAGQRLENSKRTTDNHFNVAGIGPGEKIRVEITANFKGWNARWASWQLARAIEFTTPEWSCSQLEKRAVSEDEVLTQLN